MAGNSAFKRWLLLLVMVSVPAVCEARKPRVFVTGGNSWQVISTEGESQVSGVGDATVAEGVKLFSQKCSTVEVNMRRDRADYVVAVSDDGSGAGRKGRRAVVFTQDGQLVLANSARRLSNAVKDACEAIGKSWSEKDGKPGIDEVQEPAKR